MKKFIKNYSKRILTLMDSIQVTDSRKKRIDFHQAIESVCKIITRQSSIGSKIFFIGNGGSAAIANHMAIDFWKNGKVPAQSFNDSSLLTCISNDFGYEHIFAKPLDFFAEKKDVLFTISSSGKSKNILRAARVMSKKQGKIITLSGFAKDNPLRFKGVYNFYVPSCEYGLVEIIHQYICHFILDVIIDHNKYSNLKRGRK